MRRSNFILLAVALFLISALFACAHRTGSEKDAMARLLGRRIGLEGTKLYPGIFLLLGSKASRSCPQRSQKGLPAHIAFTLIVKAIETQTDDPFLAQDLKDLISIIGIDLNKDLELINLTPEIRSSVLQFVCSFAQGVARAKKSP